MTTPIKKKRTVKRSDVSHFDMAFDVNNEIFRLEALLKAIRVAAFDQVEQTNSPFAVQPEDFPYLLDIGIDRLNIIKDHVEVIEGKFRKILEADHE